MQPAEERFDKAATERGWRTYRRGWPDRLVVDERNAVFFVEIKERHDYLRPHQVEVLALLSKLAPVFISPEGTVDGEKFKDITEWPIILPSGKDLNRLINEQAERERLAHDAIIEQVYGKAPVIIRRR
jgi:hypothetical protein